MAKVRTPLLSFGARGQLAKTLVFTPWKGLDNVREYVVPANPNTADQVTQRTLFAANVLGWRTYFVNALQRAAWNRLASALKTPMSGFNRAMQAMNLIVSSDADASFALSSAAAAGNTLDVTMINADDGAQGDEAGNFEVWVGNSPTSLLYLETQAIAAGVISTSDLGDLDDVKYVELRKGGSSRSGIMKVTLIA